MTSPQGPVTLVIGASEDENRYSNMAVRLLRSYGHTVLAIGREKGRIEDVSIETDWNPMWNVDTVTLYINPIVQRGYYEKIIELRPRRVIFNPGTENAEFSERLSKEGIESEVACTLVLLRTNHY